MAYGRSDHDNTRERARDFDRDRRPGRDSIFARGDRTSRDDYTTSARDDDDDYRRRPRADRSRDRDRDREYGTDDHRQGLAIDETGRLIASNKVEGTRVYGSDGERLGHIYNFMVDKRTGQAEYAVMAYGGFLRMGERYYPLPWRTLSYDTRAGGYRIEMRERDLKDAPSFTRDSEPRFDRDYDARVHDYYGLNY